MHHKAFWCERGELNPHGNPLDSKSSASTNSATLAKRVSIAHLPVACKPRTAGLRSGIAGSLRQTEGR